MPDRCVMWQVQVRKLGDVAWIVRVRVMCEHEAARNVEQVKVLDEYGTIKVTN